MKNDLYLLKFDPILKEKIWGGQKLKQLFHKNSPSSKTGESWEISDVEGNDSIISNGHYKGKSIKWLLEEFGSSFVGKKVFEKFGTKFPLLIKFIDAAEALSVQLHPNDKIAKEKHNSFGKTEMWYILHADQDAEVIMGFKNKITKTEYQELVETNTLVDSLNREKVKKGDAFIINPGFVHAIGAGVLLAEIQQTSDITYRIYDWDRVTDSGEKRELHTDLALDAIDLSHKGDFRIKYEERKNESSKLFHNQYFKTNIIELDSEITRDYSDKDSFVILMGVEGKSIVKTDGNQEVLHQGETMLVPACISKISIESQNAKILEVSV